MTQTVDLAIITGLPAIIAAIGSVLALLKGRENSAKIDVVQAKAEEIHSKVSALTLPPIMYSPTTATDISFHNPPNVSGPSKSS